MTYRVYADLWTAGSDLTDDGTLFCPLVIPADRNIICRAVRTKVLFVNDPVFTSLSMKIFAVRNNARAGLLATSTDVRTKAEIHTLPHGEREFHLTFDDVILQASTTYHLVMFATGYEPTSDSFLGWVKAVDPAYTWGTVSLVALGGAPYHLIIANGSDL
jgi:hypothetical protein